MFSSSFAISILNTNDTIFVSPPQLSGQLIEKSEVDLFSRFSYSIRELLTDIEKSQIIQVDLKEPWHVPL